MKATVLLEMEDYNHEAQTEFENMLRDYPDDGYVRQLYALFLTRQNDVPSRPGLLAGFCQLTVLGNLGQTPAIQLLILSESHENVSFFTVDHSGRYPDDRATHQYPPGPV